jgi:16S rRNA (cytidine1402-2'-O)-methyltransferase
MLYVIATPIGNLEDLSHRAVRILNEIEVLACEDTRRTRTLLNRYAIAAPKTILSYHEHNEARTTPRLMGFLKNGQTVGLCSDSGYPGISDPGYRLISEARAQGIAVDVIPGPSAVTMALISSGLPSSSYTFKGFPPRKSGQRQRFLEMEQDAPHTLVVFESPYRTGAFLKDALTVLGDRLAAVCIELSKKFEEVDRGFLSELVERYRDKKIRGEVTVVIAGNNPKFFNREDSD